MKFLGLGAAGACLIAGPALAQQLAPSPTLDAVQKRGHIECGVHLGLPGFSFANDKGGWTGLDVDYCKSLAAAVLGDATKVKFTPTSVQQRWPVLQSGQVDLLSRNTTITFSRNATLGVNFQGINFYEGQTFVVRTKAKVAAITAFNIAQFAYMVNKMAKLREGEGTLLDNCIMMWGSGLEDGNNHTRENLPFIIAGGGGGSLKTGRFITTKANQGDLLTTLLACMGVPVDRPIGIATKQIREMMNG